MAGSGGAGRVRTAGTPGETLYLERTVHSTSSFHLLPGIVCYRSLDALPFPPLNFCQASQMEGMIIISFYPCTAWPALGTLNMFRACC